MIENESSNTGVSMLFFFIFIFDIAIIEDIIRIMSPH